MIDPVKYMVRLDRIIYTYQIVLVIAVPACGARQFAMIPYLPPSKARVRVRPRIAALAVEY